MARDREVNIELYKKEPWRFLEYALQQTVTNEKPPEALVTYLKGAVHPVIPNPASARDLLWELLSQKYRHKGLIWLDLTGLLDDILPCWTGNVSRRKLRLNAVEQVHLEAWR